MFEQEAERQGSDKVSKTAAMEEAMSKLRAGHQAELQRVQGEKVVDLWVILGCSLTHGM